MLDIKKLKRKKRNETINLILINENYLIFYFISMY